MKYWDKYEFPCGCVHESGGRVQITHPTCNVRRHFYPTSLQGLAERIDAIEEYIEKLKKE